MTASALPQHPAYGKTYALLEELASAGGDYGIARPARLLLSQAFVELTDDGIDTPNAPPAAPSVTNADHGLQTLDDLLVAMLGDVDDLQIVLRLTRVRELVVEASRSG